MKLVPGELNFLCAPWCSQTLPLAVLTLPTGRTAVTCWPMQRCSAARVVLAPACAPARSGITSGYGASIRMKARILIVAAHVRHGIGDESLHVVPKAGGHLTRLEFYFAATSAMAPVPWSAASLSQSAASFRRQRTPSGAKTRSAVPPNSYGIRSQIVLVP